MKRIVCGLVCAALGATAAAQAPAVDAGRWQRAFPRTGALWAGDTYGRSAVPALRSAYIYGDFGSGRVWALRHDGRRMRGNHEIGKAPNISSFGEDAAGELYITSFDGGIYRLVPAR